MGQQLRRYRNKQNAAMHTPKTKTELNKIRNAVFKRSRGYKEACVAPDKLLTRIDVFLSNLKFMNNCNLYQSRLVTMVPWWFLSQIVDMS